MRKLFLLAIVLCVWSVVADAQESERRYIEVTGSSEIEVVPDEIHLLIQIKEYWKEEFVPKSKPEDYKTLKSATKPFNVLLACTCPLLLN